MEAELEALGTSEEESPVRLANGCDDASEFEEDNGVLEELT